MALKLHHYILIIHNNIGLKNLDRQAEQLFQLVKYWHPGPIYESVRSQF